MTNEHGSSLVRHFTVVLLYVALWGEAAAGTVNNQNVASAWLTQDTRAGRQCAEDSLSVVSMDNGARLACPYQRLEGHVTKEGLALLSTLGPHGTDRLRVRAITLGRDSGSLDLPSDGLVEIEQRRTRWVRAGLIEEYSTNLDGVRQDFLVMNKPPGMGELRVGVAISGASAEADPRGALLVQHETGRRLTYARLHVTDARGTVLPARMEVVAADRITITVADAGAVYPIRIDPTFSDADWYGGFGGFQGANGVVYAIAVDTNSGIVYAGGSFTLIGEAAANRVARWDGNRWTSLGTGMNGDVQELAVDGAGRLYAAGIFTSAGGVPAMLIAMWNGVSWTNLGSGVQNIVGALTVDGSDNLFVGGSFTNAGGQAASRIAMWNGSAWTNLGSGVNNAVNTLAFDGAGHLLAGGLFTNAGGVTAHRIARWNGNSWTNLGSGMNDTVTSIAVDESGQVFAVGSFTNAGGQAAKQVAMWNGSVWTNLGSGVATGLFVSAAAIDSAGDLYIGGTFSSVGGMGATNIAKWNGSSWTNLGSGFPDAAAPVFALASDGPAIYVGGSFNNVGGLAANHIAQWTGSTWANLGLGLDDAIGPIAVSTEGDLYVGGSFTTIGDITANRIAKWSGDVWTNLGSGLNGFVNALALDASNRLYVGGSFTMAGGTPATNIALWTGSGWTNLAGGLDGPVFTLTVNASNTLYAGGAFTAAGGLSANRVAAWNGTSWGNLSIGMDNDVRALAVDQAGKLYAGGYFLTAGSNSANRIAQWNGSSWTNMGSGMNDNVLALAVHKSGLLFAGGAFTNAGGIAARRLAVWNGLVWSSVGDANDVVIGLAADPFGSLYVAGQFTNIAGIAANRIAVWNANAWSTLGSGLNGPSFGLAVDAPGNLYVSGSFTTAGGTSAIFLAHADVRSISASSSDEAGNYPGTPDFFTGANRGTGFEPWSLSLGVGATATMASSTEATGNINSTNGLSFKFFGGPGGTYAEGVRPFYLPLASGDVFEVTIAYNFNGGNRGAAFLNDFGAELLFINFGGGDQLTTAWTSGPPVTLSSTYLNTAILHVAITQIASNRLAARLHRNDGYTTNLLSGPLPSPSLLRRVKFYNGGHPADNNNYALYANDLNIRRLGARPLFIDSDGDGIPNDWEHLNGLNAAVANGPTSNADVDMRTDFEEYIADTSPTNPLSFFPDAAFTAPTPGAISLNIDPSSTARVYNVSFNTNLLSSPQLWTLLPPERTGTGSIVTFVVTNDAPSRSYRTGVRLP